MAVPNIFGTATAAIPLSQLDSNFATTITLGNTAIQLGNTVTTLNNMTLANATVSSLSTPITPAQGGTGLATLTANNVMLGNGTSNVAFVAPGTSGNLLASNGTTWVSQAAASTTSISNGTSNVSIATSGGNVVVATNGNTAVTYDTSQNATFAGYINAPNTFALKNRIINGGMTIDQRNAGASVTATADTYCVDRWAVGFGATVNAFTAQQSTTVPTGFKNSLLLTAGTGASAGAGGYAYLRQMVEGLNVYDCGWGTASAATITISFWVRSSLTGTFGFVLRNSAGDRAYGATFSISTANTFEYKTVTIPGDTAGTWLTTNGVGIGMFFDLGCGTNLEVTAGSWQAFSNALGVASTTKLTATTGATMFITGVQLEKGSTATSFDYRSIGTELALCQRYYEQGGINQRQFITGVGQTTTRPWAYRVTKRATPTVVIAGGYTADGWGGYSLETHDNPAGAYDPTNILGVTCTSTSSSSTGAVVACTVKVSAEL